MGATLWYHETPWNDDPACALSALQAEFVDANYDLAALIPQHLEWARESVAQCEADGDEYGLLDMYRTQLELLERLSGEPIPDDPRARVEIVRQLHSDTGQGVGNVIDLTGVSKQREFFRAQVLDVREIQGFTGNPQPTIAEARAAISKINCELGRGECVCFPMYDGKTPAGWMFVANTID